MPKLTIIENGGAEHVLEAEVGTSLMRTALNNDVPGILADCGGNATCGTCHCFVDPAWASKLPPPGEAERAMLECILDIQETSRLSCQIELTPELDGLVVRLPASQL